MGSSYAPPSGGSSGPSVAAAPYDWALMDGPGLDTAEFVQGTSPVVADWTDVAAITGWGGTVQLASVGLSLGDKALRLVPANDPAVGASGQGVAKTVDGGDWVYACRIGLHSPLAAATATTALSQFVYVDSNGAAPDVTTQRWYGVGLYYNAQTMETTSIAAGSSVGVGGEWDSFTSSQATTWWRSTTVDLFLRRSGTDLIAYAAPAGQIPRQVHTRTVGAGSGLIGWRLTQDGTTTHVTSVLAFARLAAVPGV